MRQLAYLGIAISIVLLASCQKYETELQFVKPVEKVSSLKPIVESLNITSGTQTKSTIDIHSGVARFKWSEGDEISVYTINDLFDKYTLQQVDGKYEFVNNYATPHIGAIYPYNSGYDNTFIENGKIAKVSLPSSYSYQDGVNTNMPMIAYLEGESLSFKHLCGVAMFRVDNVPERAYSFVFTANDNITGEFTISQPQPSDSHNGTIQKGENQGDGNSVSFWSFPTGSVDYYIPLPCGEYSGFDIRIKDMYDYDLIRISSTKKFTIERASVKAFVGMDYKTTRYESKDYSRDGRVTVLQSATEGNGIDIVLMGDGFSDRQLAEGLYDSYMQRMYDAFFSIEPYKSFKHLFNVYQVDVVSQNEGFKEGNTTALQVVLQDEPRIYGNNAIVGDYAERAVSESRIDETLILILANDNRMYGTCHLIAGRGLSMEDPFTYRGLGKAYAYFSLQHHSAFEKTLIHECGHGFAKLADEYFYDGYGTMPQSEINNYIELYNNSGWYANVDFTSDPLLVKWRHFLEDSRYAYEGLGAYEGACLYPYGVYRPTENSMMRQNVFLPYNFFNSPSRESIYKRIHKLAYGDNWEYDYEEFVEYDAINRQGLNSVETKSYVLQSSGNPIKHTPPVIHDAITGEVIYR